MCVVEVGPVTASLRIAVSPWIATMSGFWLPTLVWYTGSTSTMYCCLSSHDATYFTAQSYRLTRASLVPWHCCTTWFSVSTCPHPALQTRSCCLPRDVLLWVGSALMRALMQFTSPAREGTRYPRRPIHGETSFHSSPSGWYHQTSRGACTKTHQSSVAWKELNLNRHVRGVLPCRVLCPDMRWLWARQGRWNPSGAIATLIVPETLFILEMVFLGLSPRYCRVRRRLNSHVAKIATSSHKTWWYGQLCSSIRSHLSKNQLIHNSWYEFDPQGPHPLLWLHGNCLQAI